MSSFDAVSDGAQIEDGGRSVIGYRPEIDGVRAFAIAGVVLYHLDTNWAPGGFLGVDVFFVLSGYLMVSILMSQQDAGRAFIANFLVRRVRRLLPAFFFVIGVVLCLSWTLLEPVRLDGVARSSLASAMQLANMHFLRTETDYFGYGAQSDPLLHLWSLGIEVQFYILLPFLVVVIMKWWGSQALPRVFFSLLLASLVTAEYLGRYGQGSLDHHAFYLLPARLFEFMIGALVALKSDSWELPPAVSETIAGAGLVLVLASFSGISSGMVLPGMASLIPCVGTAMVLAATRGNGFVARALSWKPLVVIGLLSYSVYLWHWPLLVFIRHFNGGEIPFLGYLAFTMLLVLFSWVSWRFVEVPMRRVSWTRGKIILWQVIFPLVLIGSFSGGVIASDGANYRYGPEQKDHQFPSACYDVVVDGCIDRDEVGINALLIGDSHAAHLSPFWIEVAKSFDIKLSYRSVSSCYPLIEGSENKVASDGALYDPLRCAEQIRFLSQRATDYDVVILGAAWSQYVFGPRVPLNFSFLSELVSTLNMLDENNVRVLIVKQIPSFSPSQVLKIRHVELIPFQTVRRLVWTIVDYPQTFEKEKKVDEGNLLLESTVRNCRNCQLFDLLLGLEDVGRQLPVVDGQLWYVDQSHLSIFGARSLASRFLELISAGEVPSPFGVAPRGVHLLPDGA